MQAKEEGAMERGQGTRYAVPFIPSGKESPTKFAAGAKHYCRILITSYRILIL
ncbi:MAG: hypothetical protein ACI81P_003137 [Neolewinella sp.]|jgi:hypothetical protein